jgi:uncharacterized protein YhdP
VADLVLHGHRLTTVEAALQQPGTPSGVWQGTVTADQLAGQMTLRTGTARTPAALQARLSRLRLPWPASPPPALPDRMATPPGPWPSLDVVVEHLDLGGRPVGRLELQGAALSGTRLPNLAAAAAATTSTATATEWRLQQLTLRHPQARLSAVGRWDPADQDGPAGLGTSRLTFRLDVEDGGRWLDQLGWPNTLRGGRGHLGGQLRWPGPPTALTLAQLGGTLRLNLDNGQWLQADPGGAGRLLGVLNLQSLPRRLSLDFRDVFQQGFSFDHLDGEVQVHQGLAHTRNLRLRGVQAMVLAEGTASLTEATQDVRVWVVPDFNAGAASLAYAVINPAVGLGTLVTQWFLQRPLAEAATREYRVTGPWHAPRIAPVDREREAQPLPDLSTLLPRKDTPP